MRTCLATVASLLVISALGCAGEEDSTSIGLHKGSSTLAAGDDGQPTIGEHATDNGNPNANTKPNAPSTVGVNGQSFDMALSDAQPAIALGGTAILSVPRLFNALAELRFPVWGEVRVLDRVARGRTLGNTIYFTAVGRAFLHDRFQMTPDEFLRIVRRRRTSIASGA